MSGASVRERERGFRQRARVLIGSGVPHHARSNGIIRENQRFRLCRARFRSLRFLCLRIFLRRFLMTLPTAPPNGSTEVGDNYCLPGAKSTVGVGGPGARSPHIPVMAQLAQPTVEHVAPPQEAQDRRAAHPGLRSARRTAPILRAPFELAIH